MRDLVRKAGIAFLALAATLIAADPLVSGEARDHGWERSGDGFWGDRPEVHAGFSDNGIALELKMPPGTAVAYSRAGSWEHPTRLCSRCPRIRSVRGGTSTSGGGEVPRVR